MLNKHSKEDQLLSRHVARAPSRQPPAPPLVFRRIGRKTSPVGNRKVLGDPVFAVHREQWGIIGPIEPSINMIACCLKDL